MLNPLSSFSNTQYAAIAPLLNNLAPYDFNPYDHQPLPPNASFPTDYTIKVQDDVQIYLSHEGQVMGIIYDTTDLGEDRDYIDFNNNGQRDGGEDKVTVWFGGSVSTSPNAGEGNLGGRVYSMQLGDGPVLYNLDSRSSDNYEPQPLIGEVQAPQVEVPQSNQSLPLFPN